MGIDGILRALGAVIGGVLNTWSRLARGRARHDLLLAIVPRVLGGQALTLPQLAGRAAADTGWPYGVIAPFELARALDALVAAGRVIGADADGRYALAAPACPPGEAAAGDGGGR